MKIIDLTQIKAILPTIDILPAIEAGFITYSKGQAIIPPIGELLFTDPPGDVHIKYGYIEGDDYYVVKIASGFYQNPKLNLSSSHGLMLVFDRKTGYPISILLDEGYLTDVRTAVAGAIVAKALAPKVVKGIGIVGTGGQAKLQLHYLHKVVSCPYILVFGRDHNKLVCFQKEMQEKGIKVQITQKIEEITAKCNLIVTTTSSSMPVLHAHQLSPGTHITAVGADTAHKQELEEAIFKKADLIVADSIEQCTQRGDISHALRAGVIAENEIIEFGNILAGTAQGRIHDDQITVADLTGIAVQDIQIAKLLIKNFNSVNPPDVTSPTRKIENKK
jgi:ornithine cyclodeaminase